MTCNSKIRFSTLLFSSHTGIFSCLVVVKQGDSFFLFFFFPWKVSAQLMHPHEIEPLNYCHCCCKISVNVLLCYLIIAYTIHYKYWMLCFVLDSYALYCFSEFVSWSCFSVGTIWNDVYLKIGIKLNMISS